YVLPQIAGVAERIQYESWVLGPRAEAEMTPQALQRLARDVLDLYSIDYVSHYERLLADIDIVPIAGLGQATEVVNVLSGPGSPIRNILEAVSEETKLTRLPESQAIAGNLADNATDFAGDEILSQLDSQGQGLLEVFGALVPEAGASGQPAPPGQFVEDRFRPLHDLVDGIDGAPSRLDGVITTMTEVYNDLNRLSLGQSAGAAILGQGGNAATRLEAEIGRLPSPMQRWVSQVASGASGVAVGGARAELNAQWQATVLPFCTRAIDGRYPFDRAARADVTLQDFGRLFAPDGLIDTFFRENLARFVDQSSTPWRTRRVNGVDIGISDAVLAQFEQAAEIRDSFFLAPGLPSVTFDVTPVALDPNVEQVTVDIDGQTVSYAHGPLQVTPITWPGQTGGRTRVSFAPARADVENTVSRDGPWAWFRLLDAAELRRTNVSDRNRLVFNIGGRIAIFQLRAGSSLNPFTVSALDSFRCPRSL
ncbi:MAG: type VI secretion system membrane subunit TssM, partial [Pseudomonadota bacterium]